MKETLASRIPAEVIQICAQLKRAGYKAYLVGGAIRDLLRLPSEIEAAKDFDIASSALPEEVIKIFGKFRTIPTGLKHGTVTVLLTPKEGTPRTKRDHVEITTFRKEGDYLDGRRPKHIDFLEDLTEDLQRRDFTINAIAYDPTTDELLDPFLGQDDIRNQWIRAVGGPLARFTEDGLRPLRAIRFSAQLGFQIEADTLAAIPLAIPTFRKVSQERIRDEILKLLIGKFVGHGLSLLVESGLLFEIVPELIDVFDSQVQKQTSAWITLLTSDPCLCLGALLFSLKRTQIQKSQLERIVARFKLPRADQTRIVFLLSTFSADLTKPLSPIEARQFLSQYSSQQREDILTFYKAFFHSQQEGNPKKFRDYIEWENSILIEQAKNPPLSIHELALRGSDIIDILKISPGKQVGEILNQLFQKVLKDPSLNTKEGLTYILSQNTKSSTLR